MITFIQLIKDNHPNNNIKLIKLQFYYSPNF